MLQRGHRNQKSAYIKHVRLHVCCKIVHGSNGFGTLIRFDSAQAAVLTVEPLSGSIILARGGKEP